MTIFCAASCAVRGFAYLDDMSTRTEWIPDDTFGGRLMLLRHQLGLTTEEIAERCDLKTPTWSTWERGAIPRGMNAVVAKIALATGVSRNWLMWGGPVGSGLDSPTGLPSASPDQPSIRHNDTELMQYRSRVARVTRRTIKVAA